MPEAIKKLLQPVISLPPARRWVVGGVVALCLLAFTLLIVMANRTEYRPLFGNLGNDDAGEIVKKLKEQKVPYRIAADGRAVLVPAEKVHELRLSLASEGLPQGGGVGFEIFDRKNFGMTEFVQKLNYQRALQGELSRTISQITGVEQARVHLVIPEKSLFKENEKPATASIILKMKSERTLRENDVQGIIHLVASSIEGMDPEHVTILDSHGKLLSRAGASDATSKLTSTMLETQRSYEKSMEERLQSLLDRVVGPGKSVARVTANLDFKQVEKLEEKYDPEKSAVRSEQRSEQKDAGAMVPAGVPGVQSNLGRSAATTGNIAGGSAKSDETLNYEVSRMTARTIEPVGNLSKLSVAILVDGKYQSGAAKGGEGEKSSYVPRSPEELQKIEGLVKSAVGFNAERGDQVTVANIPFQESVEEEGGKGLPAWVNEPFVMPLLKNLLLGISFLALIFLVIRPLLKTLKTMPKPVQEPEEITPEPHLQLEGHGKMPMNQLMGLKLVNHQELIETVKKDPYQTAQILQNWLNQAD